MYYTTLLIAQMLTVRTERKSEMNIEIPIARLVYHKSGQIHVSRAATLKSEGKYSVTFKAPSMYIKDVLKSIRVMGAYMNKHSEPIHFRVEIKFENPKLMKPLSLVHPEGKFPGVFHIDINNDQVGLYKSLIGNDVVIKTKNLDNIARGTLISVFPDEKGVLFAVFDQKKKTLLEVKSTDVVDISTTDEEMNERLLSYSHVTEVKDTTRIRFEVDVDKAMILLVNYAVPGSVWKVSHRLDFVSSSQKEVNIHTGLSAGDLYQLDSWAIVDNVLGEGVENANIVVCNSEPITFQYDLSSPAWPRRQTINPKFSQVEYNIPEPIRTVQDSNDNSYSTGAYNASERLGEGKELRSVARARSTKKTKVYDAQARDQGQYEETEELLQTDDEQPTSQQQDKTVIITQEYNLAKCSLAVGESLTKTYSSRKIGVVPLFVYDTATNAERFTHAFIVHNTSTSPIEAGPMTITDKSDRTYFKGECLVPYVAPNTSVVVQLAIAMQYYVNKRTTAKQPVITHVSANDTGFVLTRRSSNATCYIVQGNNVLNFIRDNKETLFVIAHRPSSGYKTLRKPNTPTEQKDTKPEDFILSNKLDKPTANPNEPVTVSSDTFVQANPSEILYYESNNQALIKYWTVNNTSLPQHATLQLDVVDVCDTTVTMAFEHVNPWTVGGWLETVSMPNEAKQILQEIKHTVTQVHEATQQLSLEKKKFASLSDERDRIAQALSNISNNNGLAQGEKLSQSLRALQTKYTERLAVIEVEQDLLKLASLEERIVILRELVIKQALSMAQKIASINAVTTTQQ